MDIHPVAEARPLAEEVFMPVPAGEAGTPPSIDATSIVVQEAPEGEPTDSRTCTDVEIGDHSIEDDNYSDFDDGGSEYLPAETRDESDSDHDTTKSLKKRADAADVDYVHIEELHERWNKWEQIYSDLLIQKETTALSKDDEDELSFSRRRLEGLMKRIPASDPLKENYAQILGPTLSSAPSKARKRKTDTPVSGQVKKARTNLPAQGHMVSREVPPQAKTKQTVTADIKQHFQKIEEQADPSGSHSKRGKSEVKNMKKALQVFGGEKLVELKDGCWLVPGMKTPLFGYQFDGAGWMVQQERSRDIPKGGILADEMGCGKTITMLSVILRGKPPRKAIVKSNLLLVQSDQMANQWMDQIEKHCNEGSLAASRWGRKSRLNAASIGVDQIILITYSEVERAWSRVNQVRGKAKKGRAGNTLQDADQERLLFRTKFHRLILDECQQIKNHNSLTAKAVFQLDAKFQWLISATPAPNREDEYYSYLKILQLEDTETIRDFHLKWTNEPVGGGPTRLETGLERFLLRRTRQTKFAGAEIFDGVPDSVTQTLTLALSAEERVFYNIVVEPLRTELKKTKDRLAKKEIGELEGTHDDSRANGGYMVSKILSLYKLTAHPFLLESIMLNDNFQLKQLQDIRTKLKELKTGDQSKFLDQAEYVAGKVVEHIEAGRPKSRETHAQSITSQALSGTGIFDVDLQLDYALGEKAKERRCHMCPGLKIPISAVLTECGHCFCHKHFEDNTKISSMDRPGDPIRCLCCEKFVGKTENVDQTDLAAAHDAYEAAERTGRRHRGRTSNAKGKQLRKRGDDFNGCQPKGEQSRFLDLSDRNHLKVPLVHSSKTQEILKVISRWQDDAIDDKIIVFTQWLVMGKIIGRILEDAGINFVYYFGDMTSAERSKNLETFKTDKDIKVIIMGFKCASQGLDMPHANRVILVDPWWNEDGERQAFARVLRKVQKKTTFFVRLIIEDSIDMRISDIQQSKREMTERLRKEDDPRRRSMIGVEYAAKLLDQATGAVDSEAVERHEGKAGFPEQTTSESTPSGSLAREDAAFDQREKLQGSSTSKKRKKITLFQGSSRADPKPAAANLGETGRYIKQEDTSEDV